MGNRKEMVDFPKVTICILTYNSSWNKLIETIESVLMQKNVVYEIVISDDGSAKNYQKELKEYFKEKEFAEFCFVSTDVNQGTVLNVKRAIEHSTGEYIKLISPGDILYGDSVLYDWTKSLMNSGKRWSFAKAIYYEANEGKKVAVSVRTDPMMTNYYLSGNEKKMRWSCFVNMDAILGAVTLCERTLISEYICYIEGKIIYAEDTIYRMLMFNDVIPFFYPQNTLLYEYGNGISTSKSDVWIERIRNDYMASNSILNSNSDCFDDFQRRMLRANAIATKQGGLITKFVKCFVPGLLWLSFLKMIQYRKTDIVFDI